MRTSILFLGIAALATAQTNLTSCCDVGPNTIDSNQRLGWCRAQRNTCPFLCSNGQTSANECDAERLTFTCTCLSGTTPNISDFQQTLPSLQCDEWKAQCVNAKPNDLPGQNFCLSFTCGSRNASREGAGAVSGRPGGAASTSATGGSSPSSTASGAATSTSASAAVAISFARQYGTVGVLMGVLGLFAAL